GILTFGTEEQKQNFITPVASGKAIGAYSLTEPMSGSDASNMKSRAKRDGDFYILNGRKSWVTSGPVAGYMVVFMMTDPDKKAKGITAFLVDAKTPGYMRGRKEPKLGIRASATSEILFEDCKIPAANRLGEEGEGFKIAMTVLDVGRIGIGAQALGIAEAAYEASVAYAKEREAFGQKIGEFQGTGFKIADMKTRIEASRLMVYNAAMAKERSKTTGERFTLQAAMAKLFASETAMFCAHAAVQIHGGMGYSKELPVERYFRDAKITEIYEGTSEIQRLVISRAELGLR
ncbi:MAG: acyl-CoA dehydrogenase, partial [Chloroflexi bacterium RIFOXYC12_FULL_59_14]